MQSVNEIGQFGKKINHALVETILTGLRADGYVCGIAGGYARDTFFGVKPKDLDIVVCVGDMADREGVDYTIDVAYQAIMKQFYRDKVIDVNHKVCGMYNDHASDRACGVFQFPDDGIDVILYKDCSTMQDVLDSFDFNINQFWLPDDLTPAYSGSTSLLFDGLQMVRDDCSEERAVKVSRKFTELFPAIKAATHEGRLV